MAARAWGLLVYGIAWKLTVLMIEIGDDSGGAYSPIFIEQTNQNFRLALLGAVLLGLYHSFLLGGRWVWWKWPGTALAVFGEAGAAFVVYCLICELLPTAYRPLFYDVFWFMLGGLSVLRPLVARWSRALKEDTIV